MSGWTQLKAVHVATSAVVTSQGHLLRVVGWTVPGADTLTIVAVSGGAVSIEVVGPSDQSFFMGGFPMVGGFTVSSSAATIYYDGG